MKMNKLERNGVLYYNLDLAKEIGTDRACIFYQLNVLLDFQSEYSFDLACKDLILYSPTVIRSSIKYLAENNYINCTYLPKGKFRISLIKIHQDGPDNFKL